VTWTSDQTLNPDINNGWTLQRGGNGGEKIWWESDTVGDLFELSLNESASIAIEVYTHHSLPMGQISVYVDGNFAKTIDACCEKPCVGIPGRGIYQRFVVYENENGTIAPHHIRIRNEERTKESNCIESGNKFCLVAIMGECEGWWCAHGEGEKEGK